MFKTIQLYLVLFLFVNVARGARVADFYEECRWKDRGAKIIQEQASRKFVERNRTGMAYTRRYETCYRMICYLPHEQVKFETYNEYVRLPKNAKRAVKVLAIDDAVCETRSVTTDMNNAFELESEQIDSGGQTRTKGEVLFIQEDSDDGGSYKSADED